MPVRAHVCDEVTKEIKLRPSSIYLNVQQVQEDAVNMR